MLNTMKSSTCGVKDAATELQVWQIHSTVCLKARPGGQDLDPEILNQSQDALMFCTACRLVMQDLLHSVVLTQRYNACLWQQSQTALTCTGGDFSGC